jgi:hypothetical protein
MARRSQILISKIVLCQVFSNISEKVYDCGRLIGRWNFSPRDFVEKMRRIFEKTRTIVEIKVGTQWLKYNINKFICLGSKINWGSKNDGQMKLQNNRQILSD